eukprot:m.45990 g.45990  ORF g.45990 m.45990 type:complete len:615 (-) comp20112_c0_seq1:181-2025(-)
MEFTGGMRPRSFTVSSLAPSERSRTLSTAQSHHSGTEDQRALLKDQESGVSGPQPLGDRKFLLIGGYAIFFFRYVVATYLSAFYGPYCTELGIGGTIQGLIFAVFPVGITVAAFFSPPLIMRIGTRRAVFYGMIGTAVFTLLFGLVPDMCRALGLTSPGSYAAGFAIFYFLNGLIGGIAETGTTILLTNKFKDRLGAVTTSIATVCGIGCLAGPPLGGALYHFPDLFVAEESCPIANATWDDDDGHDASFAPVLTPTFAPSLFANDSISPTSSPTLSPSQILRELLRDVGDTVGDADTDVTCEELALDEWRFRSPHVIVATFIALLAVYTIFYFGDVVVERSEKGVPMMAILSKSRLLTFVMIAMSGSIVATLDPTLSSKLDVAPFNYDAFLIGIVFMASSITYILVSIPVGWFMDKTSAMSNQKAAFILKTIQAAGFFVLFAAFALLGPLQFAPIKANETTAIMDALDNAPVVWIAMLLKGIGSSGNCAAYTDLVIGIPADAEEHQATLSGMWNAAYAIGWALGPFIGGWLYEAWGSEDGGFSRFATAASMTALVCGILMQLGAFFLVPHVITIDTHADDDEMLLLNEDPIDTYELEMVPIIPNSVYEDYFDG